MSDRKLRNFSKALRNLEASQSYEPPFDPVTETGLVALFEICMEQAWKAMKEALLEQGFPEAQTGSPRMIVKCAYSAGMIDDEKAWLGALQSRNLLSHIYDDSVALDLISRTRTDYLPIFRKLEEELEENWQTGEEEESR